MPVTLKSLVTVAVLLVGLLAPLRDARAADIPLRKSWTLHSTETAVTPRREVRPISRAEIFRAIQNELAQKGIPNHGGLRPEDLKIQSSLPAESADLGLQVKRIGFDPIRREVVFELWASHEPQFLPFAVTTRRDPRSWGFSAAPQWGNADGRSRDKNSAVGQNERRTAPKLPVLAKPGQPATLVMLGQNVRITTSADPLQPGTKGQRILVRESSTARVMSAQVIDEGLLETSF
jgi:hypothetical protein